MSSQSFNDTYQSFSNLQLYDVLQNKQDYQSTAIAAAEAEWNKRQIVEEELARIVHLWNVQQQSVVQKKEKQKAVEQKLKNYRDKLVDDLDPLAKPSTDRSIRMISLICAFILAFRFIQIYKELPWIHAYPLMHILFGEIGIVSSLIVAIGIWKFSRKKKSGWAIVCGWMIVMLILALFQLLFTIARSDNNPQFPYPLAERNVLPYILVLLFFASLLFYINRPKIREVFNFSKKFRENTLLISGLVSAIVLIATMFA